MKRTSTCHFEDLFIPQWHISYRWENKLSDVCKRLQQLSIKMLRLSIISSIEHTKQLQWKRTELLNMIIFIIILIIIIVITIYYRINLLYFIYIYSHFKRYNIFCLWNTMSSKSYFQKFHIFVFVRNVDYTGSTSPKSIKTSCAVAYYRIVMICGHAPLSCSVLGLSP